MAVVMLKNTPSGFPTRITVHDDPKIGGEGAIYFSRDGKWAIKVYHNYLSNKEQLLQYVMKLFESIPETQKRFMLPPLALVDTVDGRKVTGFVMQRAPTSYRELLELVLNPKWAALQFQQGRTWADYLKVARSIANAIMVLHGKGCAHSDIHYRNFLADLTTGEAIVLEMDGVVVQGFLPPQVKGLMGFMAPEILTQNVLPNERTDRHSLAVLILHTLLFRNVMQPLQEYDSDVDRSEEFGWGKYALFSEHPSDRRHRPSNLGIPLYNRGALSYRILTPSLQTLTERAFIDGLHNPDKRPMAREWEEALSYAIDGLYPCHNCKQYFLYPHWLQPPERRSCPFCGERCRPPYPVVLCLYEERQRGNFLKLDRWVVLGANFQLFSDVVETHARPPFTRRGAPVLGRVQRDSSRGGYLLINTNDDQYMWVARLQNGQRMTARKGESLPLIRGSDIYFGPGRRLARVVE